MSYSNAVPNALPEGVSEIIAGIIQPDGRITVSVDESKYLELVQGFKKLLVANANFARRAEYNENALRQVRTIRDEFAQSVEDNEIDDAYTQCFSIEDINRIFDALNVDTIDTIQEHTFEVTVTVTATVSKRGYGVDNLRDELEDEVNNINFELFQDYLDSSFEVAHAYTEVTVESE